MKIIAKNSKNISLYNQLQQDQLSDILDYNRFKTNNFCIFKNSFNIESLIYEIIEL